MTYDWLQSEAISAASAAITAIVTIVYTCGTFMLWKVTFDTKKSIEAQLRNQVDALYSNSRHSITASHQSLYLEILKDKDLLRIFSGSSVDTDKITSNIIVSLILNHCAAIYSDYKSNIFHGQGNYRIDKDLKDVFSLPIVISRWSEVKEFHPIEFVRYIDLYIIPQLSHLH